MSSPTPSNADDEDDTENSCMMAFAVNFVFVKTGPAGKNGARGKAKEEAKIKECAFRVTKDVDSYVCFLQAVAERHLDQKYKIDEKHCFAYKFYFSGQAKGSAISVEKKSEYYEMVLAILKDRPKKVNIIFKLVDVQAACPSNKESVGPSAEQNEDEDFEAANGAMQMSDLDKNLARIRILLEKKYRSDDGRFIYHKAIDNTFIILTPFLMGEWSRAIHEGLATVKDPPEMGSFDPKLRQTSIHPERQKKLAAITAAPQTPQKNATSDIGHVAQMLTSFIRLVQSGKPDASATATQPVTPFSPPDLTPSALGRFLADAERKGVRNARMYEDMLSNNGYGPDVIHQVENEKLERLGFTEGDTIRLKSYSKIWWDGPGAKRKRSSSAIKAPDFGTGVNNMSFDDSAFAGPSERTASKKVRYEHNFPDGGAQSWGGGPLERGESTEWDRNTTYFDEVRGEMVAIPFGFVAPRP